MTTSPMPSQATPAVDVSLFEGYTPGPWKYLFSSRSDDGSSKPETRHWHVSATEPPTAFFPQPRSVEVCRVGMGELCRANAALIAAAPELLAAYRALLDRAEKAERERDDFRRKNEREESYHDQLTNLSIKLVKERDASLEKVSNLNGMLALLPSRFQIGEKVRYRQKNGVVSAITFCLLDGVHKVLYDVNCAGFIHSRLLSDDVMPRLTIAHTDSDTPSEGV